jgi:hypothetical protein
MRLPISRLVERMQLGTVFLHTVQPRVAHSSAVLHRERQQAVQAAGDVAQRGICEEGTVAEGELGQIQAVSGQRVHCE